MNQTIPFFFCGIDPGRKGAVAIIDRTGALVHLSDADTRESTGVGAIVNAISPLTGPGSRIIAGIEVAEAFGPGSKSSFMRQGIGIGMAIAAAAVAGAEVEELSPRSWKKRLSLSSDKQESKRKFEELFPDNVPKTKAGAPKNYRDDIAEAALIAYYLFKTHTNPETGELND